MDVSAIDPRQTGWCELVVTLVLVVCAMLPWLSCPQLKRTGLRLCVRLDTALPAAYPSVPQRTPTIPSDSSTATETCSDNQLLHSFGAHMLDSATQAKLRATIMSRSTSTLAAGGHETQDMHLRSQSAAHLPATRSWSLLTGPATASAHVLAHCRSMSISFNETKPSYSHIKTHRGHVQVLICEDEPVNVTIIESLLRCQPTWHCISVGSGEELLQHLESEPHLPDIVLLDMVLPGLSGLQVAAAVRTQYPSSTLPIIVITGNTQEESVVAALEGGVNDYICKPVRGLELVARIRTHLALKQSVHMAVEASSNLSLLRDILPPAVIARLKKGSTVIAEYHESVTLLFSDISNFTVMASEWPTEQVISMLDEMFTGFDRLCDELGVYKVETIGDAYMCVAGHTDEPDHALRIMHMAQGMLRVVQSMTAWDGRPLNIRVGVHTGPAHSGVVGMVRPRYCFFGDTVNTASRMESNGFPGCVHVSEATQQAVTQSLHAATAGAARGWQGQAHQHLTFLPCGPRNIKGKGVMHTYLLQYGQWQAALECLAAQVMLCSTDVLLSTVDTCDLGNWLVDSPPTASCDTEQSLLDSWQAHLSTKSNRQEINPHLLARTAGTYPTVLTGAQDPAWHLGLCKSAPDLAAAPGPCERQQAQGSSVSQANSQGPHSSQAARSTFHSVSVAGACPTDLLSGRSISQRALPLRQPGSLSAVSEIWQPSQSQRAAATRGKPADSSLRCMSQKQLGTLLGSGSHLVAAGKGTVSRKESFARLRCTRLSRDKVSLDHLSAPHPTLEASALQGMRRSINRPEDTIFNLARALAEEF